MCFCRKTLNILDILDSVQEVTTPFTKDPGPAEYISYVKLDIFNVDESKEYESRAINMTFCQEVNKHPTRDLNRDIVIGQR